MKSSTRWLVILHILLVLFSASSVCSKLAGQQTTPAGFILCYGTMLLALGIYAIGWQQVIKRLPLTTAYANKAVTVVWGILFGALVFHESITPRKLLAACIIVAGVVLYSTADGEDRHE